MSAPLYTLDKVNDILLQRLHEKISGADDTNELVNLAGAVAKLNSSSKGNSFFAEGDTEKKRIEDEQLDALSSAQEAQIV